MEYGSVAAAPPCNSGFIDPWRRRECPTGSPSVDFGSVAAVPPCNSCFIDPWCRSQFPIGSQSVEFGSGLSSQDALRLLDAAYRGHIKTIEDLKSKQEERFTKKPKSSVSLYLTNVNGHTALHVAALYGHTDICSCLIRKFGFEVDVRSLRGATPLHLAAFCGHEQTVVYLVDAGADLSARSYLNKSVVHFAAEGGSTSLLQFFLSKGLRLDQLSDIGLPLQVAAHACSKEAMEFFLNNGANPNLVPDDTYSSLMLAIYMGSYECVKLLLEAGADPNKESFLTPPLEAAVNSGEFEIVQLLLENKANPIAENICGWSVLSLAFYNEDTQIEALLYKKATLKDEDIWRYLELPGQIDFVKQRKEAKQLYISKATNAKRLFHSRLWLKMAADVDTGDVRLLSKLCMYEALLRHGDNALDVAESFKESMPDRPEAHYREGFAWVMLKDFNLASQCFEKALELWKSCEDVYIEKEEVEQALRYALENSHELPVDAM